MTRIKAKDFGKVAVLMGGTSAEREVSLVTGAQITQALTHQGIDAVPIDVGLDIAQRLHDLKPDRAFVALHGRGGEDGVIQALLEMYQIPYTGSGVTASALTMNKAFSKWVFQSNNLLTPDFVLYKPDMELDKIVDQLGLPLCVKPVSEGSSLGVTRVTDPKKIKEAIEFAAQFGKSVMMEPWLDGCEVTVGVLNGKALPVIAITTRDGFYDYEAKYQVGRTEYLCPTGFEDKVNEAIQDLAIRAFDITGCQSWGRVDLFLDKQEKPWILEVNTIPGMTPTSLVPKAAIQLGLNFEQLVWKILVIIYYLLALRSSGRIMLSLFLGQPSLYYQHLA